MGQRREGAQAIMDSWRPEVIKTLHSGLIVEKIMENLKIEATDEDLEKRIEDIAGPDENSKEETREYYKKEGIQEYVKEDIKEQKLFDILLEKNTIKLGNKTNYVDLMANNG